MLCGGDYVMGVYFGVIWILGCFFEEGEVFSFSIVGVMDWMFLINRF